MFNSYDVVMNDKANPLRVLPPAQRFQLMAGLSLMWTTIFCTALGAWSWYGSLIVVHVLMCLGIVLTGMTFRVASKSAPRTYRDYPLADGSARYDDAWGG
ncbi:MAG: hypothetical protein FJ167_05400 [Gammaproteobacteria bacterium]|nr:hypothetical protein [Alphaproteobacteria bacterium]MBM4224220.1 hypothetical protein [Gammaproteobacteria bacterium]